MKLSVFSLKNVLFQGEAKSVNCKTVTGEITVLNNHATLITVLSAGVIKIIDEGAQEHHFPVTSGFLEVRAQNEVRLIVQ